MSLLFDLPASLQREIISTWLDIPLNLRKLTEFDGAVTNKAMRVSLRELYESLTWDEFFSCNRYKNNPAPKIRWVLARGIRFRQLKLTNFKTDSTVFEEFMKANSNFLREIKLCDTKSAMSVIMKYIAAHCTVLETLWLDNCNVTQPLALVLKKCSATLKELRLRNSFSFILPKMEEVTANPTEKKGIFAKAFCPNVRKLAILHPITMSEMAGAISAFPNVVELELSGHNLPQPVPMALRAWRQLEVVDLRYSYNGDLITEEVCEALQHSAPTLRKLTFSCISDTFAFPAFKALLSKCEKLEDVRFETNTLHDVITAVVESCGPRLLHLHTPLTMDITAAAAAALAKHCPNLRTLSAPTLAHCSDHAVILAACAQLESLHVRLGRSNLDHERNQALLQSIILHCRDLQLLSFNHSSWNLDIEEEIGAIIANNPKLHTIGVDHNAAKTYTAPLSSKVKFVHFNSCEECITV